MAYVKDKNNERYIAIYNLEDGIESSINLEVNFKDSYLVQMFFDSENRLCCVFNQSNKFHINFIIFDGLQLKLQHITTVTSGACKVINSNNEFLLYSTFVSPNVTQFISMNLVSKECIKLSEIVGLIKGSIQLDDQYILTNIKTAKDNFSAYKINVYTGNIESIFHISKYSNDRVILCNLNTRECIFTTDASGCNRIVYGNLERPNSYKLLDDQSNNHSKVNQIPLLYTSNGLLLYKEVHGVITKLIATDIFNQKTKKVISDNGIIYDSVLYSKGNIIFVENTPIKPPTLYKYNYGDDTKKEIELTNNLPLEIETNNKIWIEKFDLSTHEVETIVYKGDCSKSVGTIFYLHGGPYSQWLYQYNPMCQILSKLGYDVFCPNFRGSSGYGRSFMESIDNRWGINDLEDLVSVVNIVRDKNKNNKYILMGESYGAFLALKSIIMSPLQWDAGILLSPFISPTSLFNISSKKVKTFLNLKSGLSHTGLHKENYDEYMYRNINSKLLILHSDIDSTIPIKESIKLTQSLINAGKIEGKDFTFKKFTNADHKMNNEWMNHYISNVIEFLKTC